MTLKVKDRVIVIDHSRRPLGKGTIVNINDFRETSQKYAVDVDGYQDDLLFFGENDLSKINEKVKVKLNENGLEIYKRKNGFWESNIDEQGYSIFSYDYFEHLFFPMPYKDFSHDVILIKREVK